MKTQSIMIALVSSLFLGGASQVATAQAPTSNVYHLPLADASVGEDISLVATVAAGWSSRLELQVRGVGGQEWQSIPFERSGDTEYVAVIPGGLVQAPSFDYFIAGASEAGNRLHFASAEDPHRVYVYKDAETEVREQEFKRFHGRRA